MKRFWSATTISPCSPASCSSSFRSCGASLLLVSLLAICLVSFAGCSKPKADRTSALPATSAAEEKSKSAPTEKTVAKNNTAEKKQKPASQKQAKKKTLSVSPEYVLHAPPAQLTATQIEEGWISLFDGQTLFGWKSNNNMNWSVNEGILQADAEGKSLLTTTSPFTDFELVCEFRLAQGGNSGLFLRTSPTPQDPAVDCYELNICDSHEKFATGSLVGRTRPLKAVSGEGDWKTYHVIVEGNHIQARLDETLLLDYHDESAHQLASGRIGLQKNEGKIEFRKIWLKPLNCQPLFDGKSLAGWKTVPGSDSSFEVADGTISVKGGQNSGRGFLETEKTWDDFLLQLEVKTNGDALNSGIFFRTLSGTKEAPSAGYEMQIQNGFKNDDRRQPADHGTGAVFRRTFARWINSNDHEWFTLTLIASGPHFSTWVNGLQVTDWTDTRQPHENPRKGLRLEAGHLSIQGHDPTTDLNFRNIRIQPLK